MLDEGYPPEQLDFTELAKQLAQVDADVVLGISYLGDSIALVRALKDANVKPRMLAFTVGPALKDFGDELGADAEGVVGIVQWLRSVPLPGATQISLAVMGVGALIAVVGGAMYLIIVLASVFLGKRGDATRLTLVMSQKNPLVEDAVPNLGKEAEGKFAPRGTLVISFIFLMFFVIYYLSNWWLLGRAWWIS